MPEPTILVTGASGVVGSALLRELDGHPVIALTHHKPVATRSVRGDITKPWLGLHPREYRELAAEVSVVVHCAASVNFAATSEQLHNLNVRGVGHMLRFVADAEARLVHASTAFITRAGDGSAFDAYAESKASGETLVQESGLPASIARLSTVIGSSDSGHVPRLQSFHYLLGVALSGQLPFLPGGPSTRVDLVPQDLAAAALAALARAETAGGEHWITAGETALPMTRVIELGCDIVGTRTRRQGSTRSIDPMMFQPRLVDPNVCDSVIDSVLGRTNSGAAPSVIRQAAKLMAAYNDVDPFPTSLGRIPNGPPAPSIDALEQALRSTLGYLVDLPQEIWKLT